MKGSSKAKRGAAQAGRQRGERSPPGFDEAWALWPRLGSSKPRALAAWRAHRATGAAKLTAVRAYLASKQAQAENGRFVPFLQRWLSSSLGSFLDAAERAKTANAKRVEATPPKPAQRFPAWDAALAELIEAQPSAAAYWRGCEPVYDAPITVQTSSLLGFERLTRDFAPQAARECGLTIIVLNQRDRGPISAPAP